MLRLMLLLGAALTLMFPVFAQDEEREETEETLTILSLEHGQAEALEVYAAYLLEGEKVEERWRSDYFVSKGSFVLEEGSWSLFATGLDVGDWTTYAGAEFRGLDLEISAAPERCFTALDYYSTKAFRISCPLETLDFELRIDSQLSLLLVTQVIG